MSVIPPRAIACGTIVLIALSVLGCEGFDPSNNQFTYVPEQYGGGSVTRISERAFQLDMVPVSVDVEIVATKPNDDVYDGDFQCVLTAKPVTFGTKSITFGEVSAKDPTAGANTAFAVTPIGEDQTSADKSVRRKLSISGIDPRKHKTLVLTIKTTVTDTSDKTSEQTGEATLVPARVRYMAPNS